MLFIKKFPMYFVNKICDFIYKDYRRMYLGNFMIRLHKDVVEEFKEKYNTIITTAKLMDYNVYGYNEYTTGLNSGKINLLFTLEFKKKDGNESEKLRFQLFRWSKIVNEISFYNIGTTEYLILNSYSKESKECILDMINRFLNIL